MRIKIVIVVDKAGGNTSHDLMVQRLTVWSVSKRKREVERFLFSSFSLLRCFLGMKFF